MGTDTPISALSSKSKNCCSTYFKQLFAQVTNPPIDPIREELVMSLVSFIGPTPEPARPRGHLFAEAARGDAQPILSNEDLEKIRTIGDIADNQFQTLTLDITYAADQRSKTAWSRPSTASASGPNRRSATATTSSSCRTACAAWTACPDPLAAGDLGRAPPPDPARPAHLGRPRGRNRRGPRECISSAPSQAMAPRRSIPISPSRPSRTCLPQLDEELTTKEVFKRYIKALNKGILKVMSKMGISTYQSYCGAQIFDAVGLKSDFVEQYFFGTHTQVEGVGLDEIAEETVRCATATPSATRRSTATRSMSAANMPTASAASGTCGHPTSVSDLQHAVRGNSARSKLPRLCRPDQRAVGAADDHARHVQDPRRGRHGPRSPCRSTRSSPRPRSSSASPRAPCPSARSAARRTPRSPLP